jgi:hypothetical protein
MRPRILWAAVLGGWCVTFLLASPGRAISAEATLKVEAVLVWATNDEKSPDPKHKAVDGEIKKRLSELPLKWSHYFEVNRRAFEVAPSASKREGLSKECDLEIKNLGRSNLEITHFGRGQQIWKGTQALPKGETLVLGGNAPNATAWLIVLKRIE